MSYEKRLDGRGFNDLRPMEAKVGIIPRADGSAYFKIGNTIAYAAVYGPRNLHPKFLQNPKKGILRCFYSMMPFSGMGERIRSAPSRRAKEISMVTQKALLPVMNLEKFPNSVVDVYIELPQTDAGTRCAGITAASMALADAGIEMKDLVASVAVGKVDDKHVVDLMYDEEAYEGQVSDMPVAVIPSTGEITLLQMDGKLKKEDIKELIKMAKKAVIKINNLQRKAIKNKYKREADIYGNE